MFFKDKAKKVYSVDIKQKNKYYQSIIYISRLTFEQHRTLLIAELKSAKQNGGKLCLKKN